MATRLSIFECSETSLNILERSKTFNGVLECSKDVKKEKIFWNFNKLLFHINRWQWLFHIYQNLFLKNRFKVNRNEWNGHYFTKILVKRVEFLIILFKLLICYGKTLLLSPYGLANFKNEKKEPYFK